MTAVGLLGELEQRVHVLRERFAHRVTWQKFERAAAVVQELEEEMSALGLPVEPVEAVTAALVDVAGAIHTALDPAAPAPDPASGGPEAVPAPAPAGAVPVAVPAPAAADSTTTAAPA